MTGVTAVVPALATAARISLETSIKRDPLEEQVDKDMVALAKRRPAPGTRADIRNRYGFSEARTEELHRELLTSDREEKKKIRVKLLGIAHSYAESHLKVPRHRRLDLCPG